MTVLNCSFCGKSQNQVAKLISAPKGGGDGVICDECVKVCASIVEGQHRDKIQTMPPKPPSWIASWIHSLFRPLPPN